jgi:uncharacterized membrane protein required for colicin V production
MMSIVSIFWTFVFVFAFVGAMRGWVKELLVSFSAITALAVNLLLEKYIPLVKSLDPASSSLFWIRTLVLMTLVYFGYQTVVSIPRLASKATRDRLQDSLFGAVLGAFNGYLVVGSVLFYIHMANYPYPNIMSPATDPAIVASINTMLKYMPPRFLGEPSIYFIVIIILIFIIVVFV